MTERGQHPADPARAGSADKRHLGDPAQGPGREKAKTQNAGDQERPPVVVRDKRKIKMPGTGPESTPESAGPAEESVEEPVEVAEPENEAADVLPESTGELSADVAEELAEGLAEGEPEAPGLGAELAALRSELDERTSDLLRVSAEYANYRKRVDRDRGLVAEQATGAVLAALLPVLDDLDRARDHGDLVGPFASVADQLNAALVKFGLTAFGEKGDAFDPMRHEAVAHQTSADVTEATCVDVLRRGYLLGERLLRPALVAVADPE